MVFLNKHKFLDDQPCLTLSIIGTIFYYTFKYVGSISRHAERNYPAPQTHFPMSGSFNLINASSVFYYICRLDFQAPNHTPERCKWKTETQRAMEFEPMPRDRQRNLIFYRKHCLAVCACSLWCVCVWLFSKWSGFTPLLCWFLSGTSYTWASRHTNQSKQCNVLHHIFEKICTSF